MHGEMLGVMPLSFRRALRQGPPLDAARPSAQRDLHGGPGPLARRGTPFSWSPEWFQVHLLSGLKRQSASALGALLSLNAGLVAQSLSSPARPGSCAASG